MQKTAVDDSSTKIHIGYGVTDITPKLGTVELAGYGYDRKRIAQRVLDNLKAVAVSFSHASQGRMVAVSCDILQLDDSVGVDIRECASQKFGVAGDSIVLLATHSHTSPLTGVLEGCGIEDAEYRAALVDRVVAAIGDAISDEAPALEIATSEIEVEPPIAFNRTDAHGVLDNFVRGAAIWREGKPPVAMLSYGCHPVTLGPLDAVSADYPGRVRMALKRSGYLPFYATGFCGDTDPVSNREAWGSGTESTIDGYGAKIAAAFVRGLGAKRPVGQLQMCTVRGDLGFEHLGHEGLEQLAQELGRGVAKGSAHARVIDRWKSAMEKRIADGRDVSQPFTFRVFAVGGFALVGLPFECFTAMGDIIRKAVPESVIMTSGCADGTVGYLPAAAEYDHAGSYATLGSITIYQIPPIRKGQAEATAELAAARLSAMICSKKGDRSNG